MKAVADPGGTLPQVTGEVDYLADDREAAPRHLRAADRGAVLLYRQREMFRPDPRSSPDRAQNLVGAGRIQAF